MIIRVDCVTRAILATRGISLTSLVLKVRETSSGPLHYTDDFALTVEDEVAAPDLAEHAGVLHALDCYSKLGETVTLYGPSKAMNLITDPLVMVLHVNVADTVAQAAVGMRLDQVIETDVHPTLAALGSMRVSGIDNGDRRDTGGHAYVHVRLDPLWENVEATVETEAPSGAEVSARTGMAA